MNENNVEFRPNYQGFMTYPQSGLHKALFKWPVHLWRLGLAPLIGHHMMLITHTGRKTGLPRRTMTESYTLGDKKYSPCAFGPRAQWYQNIAVDPRVTIQTADGAESATAVRVTDGDEILSLFDAIGNRAQPMLDLYLEFLDMEPEPADIVAKKDRAYWLRFDPTDEPTPPPLDADLVWIWPVVLFAAVGILLAGRKKQRS
ncbi:MAG TPA: nitroreductase family deazaflavin-dependent oxidoreductase [candidate division Zixibacteria bacterium]|nr:nitroreductase family deazaflavin-dependent oxidoreductase [candidate division Zixibacteria bacterium]